MNSTYLAQMRRGRYRAAVGICPHQVRWPTSQVSARHKALGLSIRRAARRGGGLVFSHDVTRPLARFAQDAADILADDAKHEHLSSTQDRDRRHDGGPADDGALDPEEADDRVYEQQQPNKCKCKRKIDREAQRLHAVGNDPGHSEVDHAPERELGLSELPRALCIGHGDELEAEPTHEAAQEYVAILEVVDDIDSRAIEQHKIRASGLDVDVADRIEHAIEQTRRETLRPRILLGHIEALRDDDARAPPPFRDQGRHHLGRMLEVAIHQDDRLAARMAQPRAESRLMAEIAREGDVAHTLVALRQRLDLGKSAVGRAVVHEYDFVAAER